MKRVKLNEAKLNSLIENVIKEVLKEFRSGGDYDAWANIESNGEYNKSINRNKALTKRVNDIEREKYEKEIKLEKLIDFVTIIRKLDPDGLEKNTNTIFKQAIQKLPILQLRHLWQFDFLKDTRLSNMIEKYLEDHDARIKVESVLRSFFKKKLNEEHYVNKLNEASNVERVSYSDILKMFQENDFRNGMFVSLGYFNIAKPNARFYPSENKRKKALDVIASKSTEDTGDWDEKLKNLVGGQTWDDTMAGKILNTKKKPKEYFDTPDEFKAIIKFSRFTLNWQDVKAYGKSWADLRDAELRLRQKYGFGKDEVEYPENDWRRKLSSTGRLAYRGVGLEPLVDPKDVNKGNTYKERLGDFPLYGDLDIEGNSRYDKNTGKQRMAVRQNISTSIRKLEDVYFLVNADGSLTKVPKNFYNFLKYSVGKEGLNDVAEMQQDEKEFVREMEELSKKKAAGTFIVDKIAYMCATVTDNKTKQKRPVMFVNSIIDLLDESASEVDVNELTNFIKGQLNISNEEVEEKLDESVRKNKIKLTEGELKSVFTKLIKEDYTELYDGEDALTLSEKFDELFSIGNAGFKVLDSNNWDYIDTKESSEFVAIGVEPGMRASTFDTLLGDIRDYLPEVQVIGRSRHKYAPELPETIYIGVRK